MLTVLFNITIYSLWFIAPACCVILQCRLIISQMSGMPAELFNLLLIPLAVAVGIVLLLPRYELMTLYIYSAIVLVAHLHYAICIVEELCEHFRIYAFSLEKRDPDSWLLFSQWNFSSYRFYYCISNYLHDIYAIFRNKNFNRNFFFSEWFWKLWHSPVLPSGGLECCGNCHS